MNSDVKTEVISSGPDLTILGLFFQGRSLRKRCYVPSYFCIHMVLGNYNQ